MDGKIERLNVDNYRKCSNIWDMERQKNLAIQFYNELLSGNRITFIYVKNNAYIGEGSIVFDKNDPDYTIKGKRIYFSRLIVKKEYRHQGIGSIIVDFLIDYVKKLGYREISIGVDMENHPARNLYAKKGFNQVIYQGTDEQGEYQKLLKTDGIKAFDQPNPTGLSFPSAD